MLKEHLPRAIAPAVGPVDPSLRAFSGRLKFTIRRHKCNKDSLTITCDHPRAETSPDLQMRGWLSKRALTSRSAGLRGRYRDDGLKFGVDGLGIRFLVAGVWFLGL
jgi:hypothetical protein